MRVLMEDWPWLLLLGLVAVVFIGGAATTIRLDNRQYKAFRIDCLQARAACERDVMWCAIPRGGVVDR